MAERGGEIDVLLTHPHFWPYVRRGAEREARDIAVGLRARGHGCRVMTGAPAGRPVSRQVVDGVPVTYLRLPLPGALRRRGWTAETVFGPVAMPGLAAARVDLVHCLHYADAWAATSRMGRRRGRPVVLKLTGTILAERIKHRRVDGRMAAAAIEAADEVWCNSDYARDVMSGFDREMHIVPAGVDRSWFRRSGGRSTEPVVACTAAPDEPRKRLVEVLAAWPSVLDAVPDARLVLAGNADAALQTDLLQQLPALARQRVEFAGRLDDEGLRRLYEQAHATVTPARYEALGLATLESLAMGTPVAGARSGATEQLVTDHVGALFEPGDTDGCADAIVSALGLATEAGISERCREASAGHDIDAVLDLVLRRYAGLLAQR